MSIAVLAVVMAGLAAGGVAYATIPDSGGLIHGCYDNKGALRVIDPSAGGACKNGETALDWSQTGPQGGQGPQGPQGPTGPSNAYDSGIHSHSYGSGGDTIASLTLPAGSYLIWAPTVVTPDPTDFNSVCGLYKNDVTTADYIPSVDYTIQYDSHDTQFGRATPMATVTLSSQTTILINCSSDASANGASEIFALKVGSVN